jgi:hypothetical protein
MRPGEPAVCVSTVFGSVREEGYVTFFLVTRRLFGRLVDDRAVL